jgi:hypothetical protein
MQITNQQHAAAGKIAQLISTALGQQGKIEPATAIISCARLSGSFLFRSFNFSMDDITAGSVVLSEQANEKGPVLINIMGWMLSNFDIDIDAEKLDAAPKPESNLNFVDTLNLLQDQAVAIMNQNKLNYEEMAHSCAMATAFVIKESSEILSPESGFNASVYGFIEGSKTFPPALAEPTRKKKSFFRFWN